MRVGRTSSPIASRNISSARGRSEPAAEAPGHAPAAQDHVDVDEPERLQRFRIALGDEHGMVTQGRDEAPAQRVVGRDDEDGVHVATVATTASGKSMVKAAPPSSRLAARSLAPWVWAMEAQIASPSPEPRSLVVKNGSNTRSRIPAGIPPPVSTTATVAWSALTASSIRTMPPGGVASCAFIKRFKNSCSSSE